jgi:hypothetical protein
LDDADLAVRVDYGRARLSDALQMVSPGNVMQGNRACKDCSADRIAFAMSKILRMIGI